MAGEIAADDVGGVGVSIEMHHADVAVTMSSRHCGGRGPGDGVIAAEHEGDDAAIRHFGDAGLDVGVAEFGEAVRTVGITEVDDFEPLEDLDTEIHVVRARLVGLSANRARTESCAGTVGG